MLIVLTLNMGFCCCCFFFKLRILLYSLGFTECVFVWSIEAVYEYIYIFIAATYKYNDVSWDI